MNQTGCCINVLVIYCCVTNHSTTWQLKTTSTYISVSVGQESKNALVRSFWLKVTHKVAKQMPAGAWSSESLTGAGKSASEMAHAYGCWQKALVSHWLLARGLVSCHVGTSIGILECLRFTRANDSRERTRRNSHYLL